MSDLFITMIQSKLYWQDKVKNLEMFEERINSIVGHTDIIVLPEMFNTGFTMDTKECAEEMHGPTMDWMQKMAASKQAIVVGSLIIQEGGKFFNRLIWSSPDGIVENYDKRHLFRMAGEDMHFAEGAQRVVFQHKGWNICPLICYDLRFPVWSRNRHISEGFDFDCLIYIANWPEKRAHAWNSLLPARAIENLAYVVGVNRVGSDGNGIHYSGDSGIYDFQGLRISKMERFGERSETIGLSYDSLQAFRNQFPAYLDADRFQIEMP